MSKPNEKKLATSMRKKGMSYNEIRDRLGVSLREACLSG
jgi:hypothetical protein